MKRAWTLKVGFLPKAEEEFPPQRRRERRERRGIRELSLPLRPLRSLRLCGEGIPDFRTGQQADRLHKAVARVANSTKLWRSPLMTFDQMLPVIFMAIMGLAMLTYVILDGYDLGVGLLMPRAT